MMINPYLFIKNTNGKGRGIFTKENIIPHTIIEIAPVVVMPKDDKAYLNKTLLHDYIFDWGIESEKCCIALGYVSIYNHSYESNCEYFMNYDDDTILIKTIKKIIKDEELTINYNGDWNNTKKVWFETN